MDPRLFLCCGQVCLSYLQVQEAFQFSYIFAEKFLSEISPTPRSVRQSASGPVLVLYQDQPIAKYQIVTIFTHNNYLFRSSNIGLINEIY